MPKCVCTLGNSTAPGLQVARVDLVMLLATSSSFNRRFSSRLTRRETSLTLSSRRTTSELADGANPEGPSASSPVGSSPTDAWVSKDDIDRAYLDVDNLVKL